jgi:hypothetical protein
VKAVNLIPTEQRRGAGGVAGRSGGVVYIVVGTLAVIVALGVVYAFAVKSVAHEKGQLAAATAQVAQVQAQAQALSPYVSVQSLRQKAASGVVNLAESRFNWPQAMSQIALALPRDVTVTEITGNASTVAGAAASTTTTSTSTGGGTFALGGCASSQAEIATIISDLERIPSVSGVSLESSTKNTGGFNTKLNARPPVGANQDEASIGGQCPFVQWNLDLGFASNYTLPNQKLPAETLASGSSHANLTAATKHSSR